MVLKRDFTRRLNRIILISFSIFLVAIAGYFLMSFQTQINTIDAILLSVRSLLDNAVWSSLKGSISGMYFLFITQLITFIIAIIALLFAFYYTSQRYLVEKKNSLVDELTQLYNRKAVFFELKRELKKSERFHHPTSVVMIDIDFFKKYNDKNGHVAGDRLLRRLGKILKKEIRDYDIVGRYGGEEFIIVFPETDLKTASEVSERIRSKIQETNFYGKEKMPGKKVTVSIGVAQVPPLTKMKRDTIVKKADKRLYEAKNTGRNQVVYNK
ncbi:diguanylate cyclase [Candidatus Pacearchaeota archaeon]|nr:diguanylate cyclase [Candidatus Pacearchaeota archaeon]